ncbi:MDR family MFS transporter [Kitasatospora sp. NPDC058444]|uniref:MDR family MFS transporter n=1 Tax=Kitasatospora sp. NPDC058444 TaxID=3346504 RepID=UPI003650B815
MPLALVAHPRIRRVVQETVGGLPRQFWWLWVSTLVNKLGAFVVTFLAFYLTAERGYPPFYAGLVASLFGLGSAVAAILAGVLADRIGRRPTLLGAQLGTALFTSVLGFADGQVAIAAVAFMVGLCNNATRPPTSAIIADLVPPEDRVRAYSLNYWAINIGFGLSAAVAGLIASHGYLTLFLLDALTTVVCAVVIFLRIPETKPQAAPGPAGGSAEPPVSLLSVFRDAPFMALVGLTLMLALVFQQGSTTLAVDMGAAGIAPSEYGLVIGLNGLLIVVLQIPLTRWMEGRSRTGLLIASCLLTGWGFGLAALAGSSAWLFALSVAVWTVGEILHTPVMMGMVAELAPTHGRGRYQGVHSLSWSLASFLGPAGGGLLLQYAGPAALWTACGVVGTVTALGYVVLARRTGAAGRRPPVITEVPAPAPAAPAAVVEPAGKAPTGA